VNRDLHAVGVPFDLFLTHGLLSRYDANDTRESVLLGLGLLCESVRNRLSVVTRFGVDVVGR